jgi:hypothetical protein
MKPVSDPSKSKSRVGVAPVSFVIVRLVLDPPKNVPKLPLFNRTLSPDAALLETA